MAGAGDLKHRVAFEERAEESDEYGNEEGAFVTRYIVWAGIKPRLGGEAVTAARLTGIQPSTITVRDSPEMREVTDAWRARHVGDCPCGRTADELYNIRSIVNPDQKTQYLDILVDSGGASG